MQTDASVSDGKTGWKKKKCWKFHFRHAWNDSNEQKWWFAGTAIPLLAATIGPLANVLSIAALVTSWRMCLVRDIPDARRCEYHGDPSSTTLLQELDGRDFADPQWILNLNTGSLVVGFIGNFFLLCNFTNRIRYSIALPVTILCWYVATGLLIGATVGMEVWHGPVRPQQIYTQGFWYAVIAACMYLICAMLLMINMLGYFLGQYPPEFTLTESQRTLIIQTMLFVVWLAGGAGIFSKIESTYGDVDDTGFHWSYVNALYFCDVTILTVGFGDLYPTSNAGRGIVFPYAIGGIIILGLVVSSISKFATELGSENVVRRHGDKIRKRTKARTVSVEEPPPSLAMRARGTTADKRQISARRSRPKLLILREERDRFNTMRQIQARTRRFKSWYRLCLSVTAFGILWCCGAAVFWRAEMKTRNMTYFQALYFCYISLLTIGYGDLSPLSNAGRPFFVFWSLLSVPTMTILIGDLGETVIEKFRSSASGLADFTVLPRRGVWRAVVDRRHHLWMLDWGGRHKGHHDPGGGGDTDDDDDDEEDGLPIGPEMTENNTPTVDDLAEEDNDNPTHQDLAKRLIKVIQRVAHDAANSKRKLHHYSYEEFVDFTQLIRFTASENDWSQDDQGMIEWDWIGESSPMMAEKSEAEFVLDRLCESMARYVRSRDGDVDVDVHKERGRGGTEDYWKS